MASHLINNVKALHEAINEINRHDRLAHDTETKGPPNIGGLYPFLGSRSFSHIFATKEDEFYFNFNVGGINPIYKKELQIIFDREDRIIFYVNAVFDACISHFDGLTFKNRVVDCPSIARVEYNRHGRQSWVDESFLSMEYLAEYYKVKLKDDRVKKYIAENNLYSPEVSIITGEKIPLYDKVPIELMFEYGCGDARTTFDLGTTIIRNINYKDSKYDEPKKLIDVAKNEIKLTSVLIDMKIRGMKTDQEYIKTQIAEGEKEVIRLKEEITKLTGDININSGKQLAEFLITHNVDVPRGEPTPTMLERAKKNYELSQIAKASGNEKKYHLHLQKSQEYEKGNYVTDKKTLQKILEKHPNLDFLTKITKAKELDKKVNTYFKNFLLLADSEGYIHGSLNQEKAITGRFSASDPNLQNTHKKDKSIKRSFILPSDDYFYACIDFRQQEMIVMLDQAGELSIINKLIDKIFDDFYLATGAVLVEVAGLYIDRQQAKAVALGLAYGEGDELLASNLGMSLEDTKAFKRKFFSALPALNNLIIKLKNKVRYYGRIHNPFGRVSYLAKDEAYKALNSFIQGTSADITKVAMVNIFDFLKPYKSKLVLCVHDELVFYMHKSEKHLIPELQRLMSEAYPYKHIALGTDVEISYTNWGDKQKELEDEAKN